MDYKKIGKFITNERKVKKLTQAKLAEKLYVSEKTISKWENGNGIPETALLPLLCKTLDISVNELLNGEKISDEHYMDKAEDKLLELRNEKEKSDKILLTMEIVIGLIGSIFLFTTVIISALIEMPTYLKILLIALGTTVFLVACFFALLIEQKAGFYICSKCGHKHIPTYSQVLWTMHFGRTRYLKCPNCKKRSWQKKVIK